MGGSSSKAAVTQNITNRQITKTDMNLLNKTINNFTTTNIIKSASICASSSAQTDRTKTGDVIAKGPGSEVKIGIDSDQKTNITLKCLQQSIQQVNINNNIASSIIQQLTKNISQDTMTELISNAESKAKQGFGGIGMSSSNSTINTNILNENLNYTNVKLENLVKNTVENKTENKNIQECGTKISQNLSKEIGDIVAVDGGKIEIQFTNKQVAESFATCEQLNSQISDITSSVANSLGFSIVEDNKQQTSTKSSVDAKSTAETEGIGGMIASILSAITGPYILSSIGICLSIISVIVVFTIIMKMGGQKNQGQEEQSQEETGQETEGQTEETVGQTEEQTKETEKQKGGYYIIKFIKQLEKII